MEPRLWKTLLAKVMASESEANMFPMSRNNEQILWRDRS